MWQGCVSLEIAEVDPEGVELDDEVGSGGGGGGGGSGGGGSRSSSNSC